MKYETSRWEGQRSSVRKTDDFFSFTDEMSAAQRGDVIYVRLSDPESGRGAYGAEMGADKKASPIRPCVVVSHTAFNQKRDRVTVVPLTHYSDNKEDTIGRWSAVVAPGRGLIPLSSRGGKSRGTSKEQILRVRFFDSDDLIKNLERHLREARIAAKNDTVPWKRSLIDCGQLWTVYAVDPGAAGSTEEHPVLRKSLARLNDLKWDSRARLNGDAMFNVNSALQVVLSGDVRLLHRGIRSDPRAGVRENDLPFQQGDVIQVDLPALPAQLCVVVSSTSQDYLRSRVYSREHDRHFTLITVVPLTHGEVLAHTAPSVTVYRKDDFTATCQEIWTVYWPDRKPNRIKELSQPDFEKVQRALRYYLGLPKTDPTRPNEPLRSVLPA